ncbi:hypothetical protein B0H12DRAFT_1115786 [Mycena haematopus]|nr:hypothetical protein B0H12DRAFT_1115786 [Mycena haematopus]
MSRRLDISSLLCDEPPKKERPIEPQVVAETVVLAPHLVRNRYDHPKVDHSKPKYEPKQPEHALDTLARAAALAEKHHDPRPEPPFVRAPTRDVQRLLSPVQDHHRLRTMSRQVLEQQQQQQQHHHHHLRILQQQENARHEQMVIQAQWDRERGRTTDGLGRPMGLPVDLAALRPAANPIRAYNRWSPRARNAATPTPRLKRLRHPQSRGRCGPHRCASALIQFVQFQSRRRHSIRFPARDRVDARSESRIQSPPFPLGRRSPPGSLAGRAKARKSDPEEPDVIPYAPERYNATTVIHLPEREREDYIVEDRKHKKSHPRFIEYAQAAGPSRRPEPQQQDTRPHPLPPSRQPKEEDAHEWLLEHFADPSPDAQRRKLDPAKPLSPVPVPSHQIPSPLVPATEAAIALEEELKIEPKDNEMDVDPAEEGMEVDVEDELLSLVDDRPRMSRPALRLPSATESGSRSGSPMVSASSPSSFMLPPSERGSMPPPTSTTTGQSKSKESASRKKETGTKAASKPKASGAAAKPRARPAPKPKASRAISDVAAGAGPATAKARAPSAISRQSGSVAASMSRSRSTSVMHGGSVGPDGSSEKPEDEDEDALAAAAEDDKLYCICKTKYDEDRFMIACDKCDEWYHTQCVEMPDLVVDLVDQFFCPLCIQKNPNLSLKTTYKPRCRYGLDHPEPNSPKACHKPAQGAFSKYCSPECGLNNIKKRIDTFAKNGGKKELLWDSVKDAQKREAVVIVHVEEEDKNEGMEGCMKENGDAAVAVPVVTARVKPPSMGKVEREVASLNAVLDEIVTLREDLKEGMDIVLWRERLLDLASERAEQVGQCGWDQRLCFGDDECADFGAGVLETYEDGAKDGMQVDGAPDAEDWWCVEGEKCERHAGWQLIRGKDIAKEREKKEEALYRLTTREREIRKRIEDIVEPYNRSRCLDPGASPLKSSKLVNGNAKGKITNGDSKKGKKRKNPS